jgi:hypothetical protein
MLKLWLNERTGILALFDEAERLAERQEKGLAPTQRSRRRLVGELNKMLKQPSRAEVRYEAVSDHRELQLR